MAAEQESGATTNEELLRKVVERLDNVSKTQELLLQALTSVAASASSADSLPYIPGPQQRLALSDSVAQNTANLEVDSVNKDANSMLSATLDEQSDANESLFVATPLPKEEYSLEGFKEHIRKYPWPEGSLKCVEGLLREPDLYSRPSLFYDAAGDAPDGSHNTFYSIYDVGSDGAPLPVRTGSNKEPSRALQIWNRMRSINADPSKERQAVGRITIIREPSPILFAAAHYTHHKHIDVDEMMGLMVDDSPVLAHPHRAFDREEKLRRSFTWTFEYFTIVGEECKPMDWQYADLEENLESHVPIGRCSASLTLSFEGPPIGRVKNRDRRAHKDRKIGDVYDPFAPWRLLVMTAYPDWRSSTDTFNSSKTIANGPEAFLMALISEYNDVRKRLNDVYEAVSDLVEPPTDFIFHQDTRDMLLFEDEHFTYSRRYFWAFQTLDIMNQDIEDMVNAYKNSFKDSVWDGTNKIIWPGEETQSSRYTAWRKRMKALRRDFEYEIKKLEEMEAMNHKKIKAIKALRDNLFSGTSVMESRRSIQMAELTIRQNNNIKLLTLVTIFFLPLTFVTSVFGMTNMPQNANFLPFAWSVLAICIPTYLLIGSLNSTTGFAFWSAKTNAAISAIGRWMAWVLNHVFKYHPLWTEKYSNPEAFAARNSKNRGPHRIQRSWSEESARLKRQMTMNPNIRSSTFSRTATFDSIQARTGLPTQNRTSSSVQLPKVTSFPLRKPQFPPIITSGSSNSSVRFADLKRSSTFDEFGGRVESPLRSPSRDGRMSPGAMNLPMSKESTIEDEKDEGSKSSEEAIEERDRGTVLRSSFVGKILGRRRNTDPGV